jgi:septation ring formation regulator EzrA
MSIQNQRQLENTRSKLEELEELFQKLRKGPTRNDHVRELTLRSLQGRINQFREEIARFETRVCPAAQK